METPRPFPGSYNDIDWNLLWQQARKQKSWQSKSSTDWDKKAASFAKRNQRSPYVSLFLEQLPLERSMSVLDVGCGPGTLALPLAKRVDRVTCLDYSSVMLDLVRQATEKEHLDGIRMVNCSWEDDWEQRGVGCHDIAIASRSIGVHDLRGALQKLNDHANRFVFVTDRISPTPFDPEAFSAIGREFNAGPDYIYTANCLYSMGIHPSITILGLERDFCFSTMEEAFDSYAWMFQNLSSIEKNNLEEYIRSRIISSNKHQIIVRRKHPPRWAMIHWKKE